MKNNKAKYIASSILAGSILFTTGCSSENNTQEESTTQQQGLKNDVDFKQDANVVYAKVTAINNNQITTLTAIPNTNKSEMPQDGERPEMPEGERPEMPQDGQRPEMPQGGERPEMPQDGEGHKHGENPSAPKNIGDMISFSGEEKIITVTDDIKITMEQRKSLNSEENSNDEPKFLSIDDISVGSIIRIKYNEDKTVVESIELTNLKID